MLPSRGGAPVTAQHRHTPLPTSSPRGAGRQGDFELQPRWAPAAAGGGPPDAFATFTIDSEAAAAGGSLSGIPPRSARPPEPRKGGGSIVHMLHQPKGVPTANGLVRTSMSRRAPDGASPKAARLGGGLSGAGGVAALQRPAACRRLPLEQQPQQNGGDSSPLPVSTDLEYPVAAAAVAAVPWSASSGLQHPTPAAAPPGEAASLLWRSGGGGGGGLRSAVGGAAWRAVAAARSICAERLHFGSSWALNCVVVATAPLVLLMHTTMPAIGRGGSRLQLIVPLGDNIHLQSCFALLFRTSHTACLLARASAALCLLALAYAQHGTDCCILRRRPLLAAALHGTGGGRSIVSAAHRRRPAPGAAAVRRPVGRFGRGSVRAHAPGVPQGRWRRADAKVSSFYSWSPLPSLWTDWWRQLGSGPESLIVRS